MEDKKRSQPKSKKAMEYRVYWLERKLKHQKLSEHRTRKDIQIEAMAEGPLKAFMHLNNEFNRANEKSAGLTRLTEELNRDTLTLNERTERLHELSASKLAATDRNNRQSRRIQERARKINKESLRTAAQSRAVNKNSQEHIKQLQKRVDEAVYLSDLTRAQHQATDELNQQTRMVNEEAVKSTAHNLKINRQLTDTRDTSRSLNQKSVEIQAELSQLKDELSRMQADSRAINEVTQENLTTINHQADKCQAAAEQTQAVTLVAQEQIDQSIALVAHTEALNIISEQVTKKSTEQQQSLKKAFSKTQTDLAKLGRDLKSEVTQELVNNQQALLENQQVHADQLAQHCEDQNKSLASNIDRIHDQSQRDIEAEFAKVADQLEHHIQQNIDLMGSHQDQFKASFDSLSNQTELALSSNIDQFSQDARLRFSAFDSRSQSLTDEFSQQSKQGLEEFNQNSRLQLEQTGALLEVLSNDVATVLSTTQESRIATDEIQMVTQAVNDNTVKLNAETQTLIARSTAAIDQLDSALNEVNGVSRKLFQETRLLQDRAGTLNEVCEQNKSDLEAINQRSLVIQQDSLQTQTLTQEINLHSINLNEQSEQLQTDFYQIRDSNKALVDDLGLLKQNLIDLGSKSEEQLALSQDTTLKGEQTVSQLEQVNEETQKLNAEVLVTLERSNTMLQRAEQQCELTQTTYVESTQLNQQLEQSCQQAREHSRMANDAADRANQSIEQIELTQSRLASATVSTQAVCVEASERIQELESITSTAETLNNETRAFQSEMQQVVSESRLINDEFMRGLESIGRSATQTNTQSQSALAETQSLQSEIHNILDLKTGIDQFQTTVDDCQTRLETLIGNVDECLDQNTQHETLIQQYKQRMESYQQDVTRYRESIVQLELRLRTVDDHFQTQELRIDDQEHQQEISLNQQREKILQLEQELEKNFAAWQADIDRTLTDIRAEQDKAINSIGQELRTDFEHKLELSNRSTNALLHQTEGDIKLVNSEVQQLNRSLVDEIESLRKETTALNDQNHLFQQEQIQDSSEQRTRVQQQEFELDTIKHQLENYQRLMEAQFDNAPHEKLQLRVKQLESNLRQQQRIIKSLQSENEKPQTDARVTALQQMVENLNRSMQDVVATNNDLKSSNQDLRATLADTYSSNQALQAANTELETNVASRQNELQHCLQRIQRLEAREESFEDVLNSLKSRDSDTQQTLHQMRNAVKDSTKTMRETQKTLQTLNNPDKKREWLSPKQAVLSSVLAAAVTGFGFFGFDDVNASLGYGNTESLAQKSMIDSRSMNLTSTAHTATKKIAAEVDPIGKTLSSLQQANASIADLGEFAWPVNFGIVDPAAIEYKNHHKGINIQGEFGDPVVAVNDGTVIYSADEIRGYGNMILIQHDDDLVSIYANNQFNYVKVGDTVKRGQLIGDIGQLTNEDAAGLYFEIRQKGEATDPFNYLRHQTAGQLSQTDMISAR